MTDETLAAQWRERLANHADSGLTVNRWCVQHDIPAHRFFYWRRKLVRASAPVEGDPVDWFALPVGVASAARLPLTVRVGDAAIDVEPGFDPALLRDVVAALSLARC
jgi:hypothetical protein